MGGAFRVVPSLLGAGFLMLGCCGCESTAEQSAAIEKQAKHVKLASQGVSVTRENPSVKVLRSTVVHSSEGTAVVVALRNGSSHQLDDTPIELTVRDAKGSVLFRNDQPGEDPSLTHVALLAPGAETVWVDDQVQVVGVPASASALVGEAKQATGSVPRMSVSETHSTGEAGAAGTVTNRSSLTQHQLVVYAVASRGGKVVAAGRAVLPEVSPGASAPFQVYFVGDPSGARIQTSAPATTSG
jgi:hypothetical protein